MENDSKMNISDLNISLYELAIDSLNLAEKTIGQGEEMFHPFISSLTDGKKSLRRFVGDEMEELVDQAIDFLENSDNVPDSAAIVFIKKIAVNGEFYPSIYLQLYSDEEEYGYAFAKAFRYVGEELILTDWLYMGDIRNVLVY